MSLPFRTYNLRNSSENEAFVYLGDIEKESNKKFDKTTINEVDETYLIATLVGSKNIKIYPSDGESLKIDSRKYDFLSEDGKKNIINAGTTLTFEPESTLHEVTYDRNKIEQKVLFASLRPDGRNKVFIKENDCEFLLWNGENNYIYDTTYVDRNEYLIEREVSIRNSPLAITQTLTKFTHENAAEDGWIYFYFVNENINQDYNVNILTKNMSERIKVEIYNSETFSGNFDDLSNDITNDYYVIKNTRDDIYFRIKDDGNQKLELYLFYSLPECHEENIRLFTNNNIYIPNQTGDVSIIKGTYEKENKVETVYKSLMGECIKFDEHEDEPYITVNFDDEKCPCGERRKEIVCIWRAKYNCFINDWEVDLYQSTCDYNYETNWINNPETLGVDEPQNKFTFYRRIPTGIPCLEEETPIRKRRGFNIVEWVLNTSCNVGPISYPGCPGCGTQLGLGTYYINTGWGTNPVGCLPISLRPFEVFNECNFPFEFNININSGGRNGTREINFQDPTGSGVRVIQLSDSLAKVIVPPGTPLINIGPGFRVNVTDQLNRAGMVAWAIGNTPGPVPWQAIWEEFCDEL